MTVSYSRAVATNSDSAFLKLLFRWKGSVYKAIWWDFLSFLVLFGTFSLIYRLALYGQLKREFEHFCLYCGNISEHIPIGLFLGFYVNIIVGQWWGRFCAIPWPDSNVLTICTYVQGASESVTVRKYTLIRYIQLIYCLFMRDMSPRLKRRYPTLDKILEAGFLTKEEKEIYLESAESEESDIKWLPILWGCELINQLRTLGALPIATSMELVMQEFRNLREGFGSLWTYNYLSVPIAYTQISTIIIYSYFVLAIFAWQRLDPSKNYIGHNIDLYIPCFGMLRLAFLLGWVKVAEILINPLGNDEDDFDTEDIFERNLEFTKFWVKAYQGEIPDTFEVSMSPENMSRLKPPAFLMGEDMSYKRRSSSTSDSLVWGSLSYVEFENRERPSPR